jgi:hypothetical protein
MPRVPVLTSGRELPVSGFALRFLDTDQAVIAEVEVSQDEASLAGSYWSYGYRGFLETGDTEYLDFYRGRSVGGYPLMTDPDLVEAFYFDHGHIDFQEYYQP